MFDQVLKQVEKLAVVPVVAIDDASAAGPLADALVAGGLPAVEITFRTPAAEQAIRAIAKRGDFLIFAGTVLNVDTAQRAIDAGATIIVAPGFNPKVVSWCVQNNIPVTPGTVTPTEIEMALDHGLTAAKFFPAETFGGLKAIKALAAPYGMMRFIPTGGVTDKNLGEYLSYKPILAVGGSWFVSKDLIGSGKFDEITRLTKQAVEIARAARPAG